MQVLDVLPGGSGGLTVSADIAGAGEVLTATPPAAVDAQEGWARSWAQARIAAKGRRDYKEADRIRDLLKAAGWEVRDNRDGTVEVRRS